MRIWDIHPGYLNRQSLLGEHRELHGIFSVITNNKRGYANHPETLRWRSHLGALSIRHGQLRAEMTLRGYNERSPLLQVSESPWPGTFVDEPLAQYRLLEKKYEGKSGGRIPLPHDAQSLWRQHKYSVMARDVNRYKALGPIIALMRPGDDFSDLALEFALLLRESPTPGGIKNALLHMWGYCSKKFPKERGRIEVMELLSLARLVQRATLSCEHPYLLEQTALSDLAYWGERYQLRVPKEGE